MMPNMKLGEDLDKVIDTAGGLSSFFNNKYQETLCMNSSVIYIIDEAQGGNYFHQNFMILISHRAAKNTEFYI